MRFDAAENVLRELLENSRAQARLLKRRLKGGT